MAASAPASTAAGRSSNKGGASVVDKYLKDPAIQQLRHKAQDLRHQILISDYTSTDKNGEILQWVDLVMEGGGMLGIAHVGAVAAFEEAGIRFLGIAGTSAGAINAALTTAVRPTPDEESWKRTLEIMVTTKFDEFEDGDASYVKFRRSLKREQDRHASPTFCCASSARFKWVQSIFRNFETIRFLACNPVPEKALYNIYKNMGAHPGNKFLEWIMQLMTDNHVKTLDELQAKLTLKCEVRNAITGKSVTSELNQNRKENWPLKLIAAEVTEHKKVQLPQEKDDYWGEDVHPAEFVRCSMSIPIFFQPVRVKRVKRKSDVPEEAVFVDGGLLSNFSIDAFHVEGVPPNPTLGVRVMPPQKNAPVDDAEKLLTAMDYAIRNSHDIEFLDKHPDYKELITKIDTTGFDSFDFKMKEDDQKALFKKGMEAAIDFMKKWTNDSTKTPKWEEYKRTRKELSEERDAARAAATATRTVAEAPRA